MIDYAQEQEMEIEALEAILMDEFRGPFLIIFLISSLMLDFLSRGLILMCLFNCYTFFSEIDSSESGLKTSNRCFQIVICPQVCKIN
jgi:hypothetical protein